MIIDKDNKMSKKKERQAILEMLQKMESEGFDYYFNYYQSVGSLESELPFAGSFINSVRSYIEARQDLEADIQMLKDQYNIDNEDVNNWDD